MHIYDILAEVLFHHWWSLKMRSKGRVLTGSSSKGSSFLLLFLDALNLTWERGLEPRLFKKSWAVTDKQQCVNLLWLPLCVVCVIQATSINLKPCSYHQSWLFQYSLSVNSITVAACEGVPVLRYLSEPLQTIDPVDFFSEIKSGLGFCSSREKCVLSSFQKWHYFTSLATGTCLFTNHIILNIIPICTHSNFRFSYEKVALSLPIKPRLFVFLWLMSNISC